MTLSVVRKPKTRIGKKFLIKRDPKLIENVKQTLFVQGRKTSSTVVNCLKDLYQLKKPDAFILAKNNDILPFDDATKLEGFGRKYDSSLFAFGSHSKKKPHNLILGRMFDGQILDMVELGIENFKSLSEFSTNKIAVGTKPCILFAGPDFDQDSDLNRIQNLIIDFFQRETVESIRLQGIDHVLMFTVQDNLLFMRSYRILLKKSGTHYPRIELEEIGPSVDFNIKRKVMGSQDLFAMSCKQPKELKAKKVKNITRDSFGSKLGRIHVKQQNIDKLQTRKMKGLRKSKGERRKTRSKVI